MSPVALIWIALLHAFSVATASTAVRRDDAGGSARHEISAAGRTSPTADVPAPHVRVPLRVPLRVAQVDAWRFVSPIPHGKGGSALPVDHRLRSLPAPFFSELRHQRATETHRLDSRGALLPYFPTAPPRRA